MEIKRLENKDKYTIDDLVKIFSAHSADLKANGYEGFNMPEAFLAIINRLKLTHIDMFLAFTQDDEEVK